MLILMRQKDEAIILPEQGVEIRVASLSDRRVRLAIDAPREVGIRRAELLRREDVMSHDEAEQVT